MGRLAVLLVAQLQLASHAAAVRVPLQWCLQRGCLL
jgi:hypothetical protein